MLILNVKLDTTDKTYDFLGVGSLTNEYLGKRVLCDTFYGFKIGNLFSGVNLLPQDVSSTKATKYAVPLTNDGIILLPWKHPFTKKYILKGNTARYITVHKKASGKLCIKIWGGKKPCWDYDTWSGYSLLSDSKDDNLKILGLPESFQNCIWDLSENEKVPGGESIDYPTTRYPVYRGKDSYCGAEGKEVVSFKDYPMFNFNSLRKGLRKDIFAKIEGIS